MQNARKNGGRLNLANDFLVFLPTDVLTKLVPFQVVVTKHALAMLSREVMIMCRKVHTQLRHIEHDVDLQATNTIHIILARHWDCCHQTLSFMQFCLPSLQEMILHIPFSHCRVLDSIRGELRKYLEDGGERGPRITIVTADGLQGCRSFRRKAPRLAYWLLHDILHDYVIDISMRYVHVCIDEESVSDFIEQQWNL